MCSRATIRSTRGWRRGSRPERSAQFARARARRPEHEEVRQGKIDQEAHADGERLADQHRHEIGRDHHRDRIGDEPGDLRRDEADIGFQAQLALRLGGERDLRVHHIGAGHGDGPGNGVGDDDRQAEIQMREREHAEIDERVDHADAGEADRLRHEGAIAQQEAQALEQAGGFGINDGPRLALAPPLGYDGPGVLGKSLASNVMATEARTRTAGSGDRARSRGAEVGLSIVVPVLNEAAGLAALHARLVEVARRLAETRGLKCEVVYVDDGSRDATFAVAQDLPATSLDVQVVSLSRNFGKEAALLAGLDHARLGAVLFMDGDGQHPPDLIDTLVSHWLDQGYDVAYTAKRD